MTFEARSPRLHLVPFAVRLIDPSLHGLFALLTTRSTQDDHCGLFAMLTTRFTQDDWLAIQLSTAIGHPEQREEPKVSLILLLLKPFLDAVVKAAVDVIF